MEQEGLEFIEVVKTATKNVSNETFIANRIAKDEN